MLMGNQAGKDNDPPEVAGEDERSSQTVSMLEELLGKCSSLARSKEALEEALGIKLPENDVEARLMLCQIRAKAHEHEGLIEEIERLAWLAPGHGGILAFHVRQLARERRSNEALALLDAQLPDTAEAGPEALAIRAKILAESGFEELADGLYARLIADRPGDAAPRLAQAANLQKRGWIIDAQELLRAAPENVRRKASFKKLAVALDELVTWMEGYERRESLRGRDYRLAVMSHAVFRARDHCPPVLSKNRPGHLVLATGSLGAGGAEKQMTRLAIALAEARQKDTELPVVEVAIRSTRERNGNYFAKVLGEHGIRITRLDELTPIAHSRQNIEDTELLRLLDHLPPIVHFGITRFLPLLTNSKPSTVSLWQDGSVPWGALAALVAGAPSIQVVFRGLPPNLRKHRERPEFEPLYRALAEVPHVQFLANSKAVAEEYAKWLGLPENRIQVLYNAIKPLPEDVSEREEVKWRRFEKLTDGSTCTIGGVFRFQIDKSPLLWAEMVRRYLQVDPWARFVLVGSGPFQPIVRQKMEEFGIAERVLFVGASDHVGYWLRKMDVKVLLSQFEGLPNVLLEAQSLGVPVVATPAGGSGECFAHRRTGVLLGCAANPSMEDILRGIQEVLAARRADREGMAREAQAYVDERFNLTTVLARFKELLALPGPRTAAN